MQANKDYGIRESLRDVFFIGTCVVIAAAAREGIKLTKFGVLVPSEEHSILHNPIPHGNSPSQHPGDRIHQ